MANDTLLKEIDEKAVSAILSQLREAPDEDHAVAILIPWLAEKVAHYNKATHSKTKTHKKVAETLSEIFREYLNREKTALDEKTTTPEYLSGKYNTLHDLIQNKIRPYLALTKVGHYDIEPPKLFLPIKPINKSSSLLKDQGTWNSNKSYIYELLQIMEKLNTVIFRRTYPDEMGISGRKKQFEALAIANQNLKQALEDERKVHNTNAGKLSADMATAKEKMEHAQREYKITADKLKSAYTVINGMVEEAKTNTKLFRDLIEKGKADHQKALTDLKAQYDRELSELREASLAAGDEIEKRKQALDEKFSSKAEALKTAHEPVAEELRKKQAEFAELQTRAKQLQDDLNAANEKIASQDELLRAHAEQNKSYTEAIAREAKSISSTPAKSDKPTISSARTIINLDSAIHDENLKLHILLKGQEKQISGLTDVLLKATRQIQAEKRKVLSLEKQLSNMQWDLQEKAAQIVALQGSLDKLEKLKKLYQDSIKEPDSKKDETIAYLQTKLQRTEEQVRERDTEIKLHKDTIQRQTSELQDAETFVLSLKKGLRQELKKKEAEIHKLNTKNNILWDFITFLWITLNQLLGRQLKTFKTEVQKKYANTEPTLVESLDQLAGIVKKPQAKTVLPLTLDQKSIKGKLFAPITPPTKKPLNEQPEQKSVAQNLALSSSVFSSPEKDTLSLSRYSSDRSITSESEAETPRTPTLDLPGMVPGK